MIQEVSVNVYGLSLGLKIKEKVYDISKNY